MNLPYLHIMSLNCKETGCLPIHEARENGDGWGELYYLIPLNEKGNIFPCYKVVTDKHIGPGKFEDPVEYLMYYKDGIFSLTINGILIKYKRCGRKKYTYVGKMEHPDFIHSFAEIRLNTKAKVFSEDEEHILFERDNILIIAPEALR